MAYQDPAYQGSVEKSFGNTAGAASASVLRYAQFQKAKLKKVHAVINVAGTNAAAAADVYIGTASVGTIVLGINTAGAFLSSAAINADVAQGSLVELRGIANSATVNFSPTFEFQLYHDGTAS